MIGKRPDQQDTISIIRGFRNDSNGYYFGIFDGHAGKKKKNKNLLRQKNKIKIYLDKNKKKLLKFTS